MLLTGAEIVIECLKEQKVDTIFGYPGGTILNIYDALYKHSDEINHYLTSHEQGAAHAADGYARATGKVGVCFATSGPGSTNLITGIATAHMDSVPMVAITVNVAKSMLGTDGFQEVDIVGATMPLTKHNYIVKDVSKLAETIRKAFYVAASGRKGPVLIDITKDVTAEKAEYKYEEPKSIETCTNKIKEHDLKKVAELIKKAKKPFILAGAGVVASDAAAELKEFASLVNAPVCDTLLGKGAFDGRDELYTGMLGMHGTKTANLGVTKCDLLISVGSRFSDRVTGNAATFARKAKVIHFDVDEAEINKNVKTAASVVGDIKEILQKLNPMLERVEREEWIDTIKDLKKQFPLTYDKSTLTGPYIIEKIYELTNGEAVITTDVGQHQMWSAQFYKYSEPKTFISSGGLGTMGYGLGACIGAKVGKPDKKVINIAGDGCFRMNMNELATATRYDIPIVEVVLNNHALGMVRQWQTLFYDKRYSSTTLVDKVDFVKLAEAMGAKAYRITKLEEAESILKEALSQTVPVLIECVIDTDDKVFPMVAPNTPISEVFAAEDLKDRGLV